MSTKIRPKTSAMKGATTVSFTGVDSGDPHSGQSIVPSSFPTTTPPPQSGYLEGEWGASDLKLARLDLKHAVDSRFSDVTPGYYVYSRSTEDYFPLVPPFQVIFLKVRKGYLQTVEPGEIPLMCWTRQELTELGGTLDKNRPDLTLFAPFCDTLLLIDRTAHAEWPDTLLLDVSGNKKALATYRAKTSAFSEIGSVLAGHEAYQRMAKQTPTPLWTQTWKLGSMLRKLPSFTYFVPTLQRLDEVSRAEAEGLKELAQNL